MLVPISAGDALLSRFGPREFARDSPAVSSLKRRPNKYIIRANWKLRNANYSYKRTMLRAVKLVTRGIS